MHDPRTSLISPKDELEVWGGGMGRSYGNTNEKCGSEGTAGWY